MPARFQTLFGVSLSVVRTRFGSSRSSKKMSRISSCVMVNSKSSSPSPESAASLPLCPPPDLGLSIASPGMNSLLPGRTKSCSPDARGSRRKRGSFVPLAEILILRSLPMSATAASFSDFCTASRICVRARRRKRWRLPRLLPFGFRRRSTKWVMGTLDSVVIPGRATRECVRGEGNPDGQTKHGLSTWVPFPHANCVRARRG